MDHSTEVFLRIEAIFDEALATSGEARTKLIETLSDHDKEIAAEVDSLLQAYEEEQRLSACLNLSSETAPAVLAESRRIGPYSLDRLLGRGGMGAVYLAHRADGQFDQVVAVKLIDLPLATALFRERFRQERQILAGLHHPYIARLLDGGVTKNGDLYLVMEYVDGVPIHQFCERLALSVPQRLALLLRVCEAVQFAHQHFVVHRDLKPDNILVSEDGTPHLLDFGTAKLLSLSHGASRSEITREGFRSFTPQYASPEQVLGESITAASDTYSLGVLFYFLLTGVLPYELKEMTTAEMLRVICQEPPRRTVHAANSDKRIDSDLEAILMKALRKEPRERYPTVEQLARDLRAYLCGQPVAAHRGTLRYRGMKFARRHGFGLAAAASLLLTLAAGVLGIAWQARVAMQQRRMAEARSADLRQISDSLLSELDEAIKQLPGSTSAQKLLVIRALEHLDRMAKDAQDDRQAKLDLIDAYTRLGNLQGNAYDQNLGDTAGALISLGKARDLAVPLAASGARDPEAMRALALVEQSRSEVLWQSGKTPEAVSAMQDALRSFDSLVAGPRASAAQIAEVGGAYNTLGDELGQPGTASLDDLAGALDAYRKDLSLVERALRLDPNLTRAKRALAIVHLKIANVEMETDPALALKDFQTALQRTDALAIADQNSLSTVRLRTMLLRKEADCMVSLGEYPKALPLFAEAEKTSRSFVVQDPQDSRALADLQVLLNDEALGFEAAANPVLAIARGNRRANLLAAELRLAEATAILEKMRKADAFNQNWKSILADAQVRLGTIRWSLRTSDESATPAREGLATLSDMASSKQAAPMTLDYAASAFLKVEPSTLKDPRLALSFAEREVAQSHGRRPSLLLTLAEAFCATGQFEKGRDAALNGLSLLPDTPAKVKPNMRKLLEFQAQRSRRPAGEK